MKLPFGGTLIRKDSREASDAGLLLWRRNFRAFIPFFIVPFLLFAVLSRVILPDGIQYFSWLIIWLCKPLFDRPLLHVISMRFFDKDADVKRLFRGLWKTVQRGLAGDLLWRRFSPLRSAMMPVRALEQNIKSPARIKERRKHLEKGEIGYCFFLTIWGAAVETALLAGGFLFFISMSQTITGDIISSLENLRNVEIIFYSLWCLNIILIEPVYVCMGFSLYINSRMETEGWDIEITFRNIAEKLKNAKNALIVILLLTFQFIPAALYANDEELNIKEGAPLETLNKILNSSEFGGVEETWGIRFKNENDYNIDNERLSFFQRIFAYVLRILLICIIAGLIVFLFFYLYRIKGKKTGETIGNKEKYFKDVSSPDPKILLGKAINLHNQGEVRLAWGYCACAAIQLCSLYKGVLFPADATENDCVNMIKKTSEDSGLALSAEQIRAFEELINKWIYLAYAGRVPAGGSFEQAVNFCKTLETRNG